TGLSIRADLADALEEPGESRQDGLLDGAADVLELAVVLDEPAVHVPGGGAHVLDALLQVGGGGGGGCRCRRAGGVVAGLRDGQVAPGPGDGALRLLAG